MSFHSIPILDLSQARDAKTKPAFLDDLRSALLHVGFLYISNTGIDETLIQDVITQGKAFFALPDEKKLEIQMKNAPSFLGTSSCPHNLFDSRAVAYILLVGLRECSAYARQATASSATKSQRGKLTFENKSIFQPHILYHLQQTPYTITYSLRTNGQIPPSYRSSAPFTKITSGKCPCYQSSSLL